jgi:hypothetical protein
MKTSCEVVAENPALYFEIQSLNPLTPEVGEWLRSSVNDWMEAVGKPEGGDFMRLMTECRDALSGLDTSTRSG